MTVEAIEGEYVDLPVERALVVQQPGQSLVAEVADPSAMVAVAVQLADALSRIVEQQKLYAVIQGKKYPQVEAWMTIARLDNVVAREPQPPIRHEDGSYEAFAELIRLSDGMVIGSSSALCGTPDDKPWGGTPGRPEPARRSMAQTRATSRAFRQQYSWVMALAGYEPTPAEEMPVETSGHSSSPAAPVAPVAAPPSGGGTAPYTGVGTVEYAKAPADGNLRETPEGWAFGFVLLEPNDKPDGKPYRLHVLAEDALATALAAGLGPGVQATVEGTLTRVPFGDGTGRTYRRVIASRVITPDFTVPGGVVAPERPRTDLDAELDALPW